MRVLLVEDDEYIAQAITATLAEQHYTVDLAKDGQMGWDYAEAFTYDLILLDVVLPKMDGIALCRQLRSRHRTTPILLLTSRDSSASKVEGLDAGADDYVVKPFDFLELSARIRALMRRGSEVLPPVLEWGEVCLNPSTCEVTYRNKPLNLTPKEYALLELFLRNNQRVFSRRAILDHLWSFEEPPAEETVRAHIKGLRSKLKTAGAPVDLVETVYGLGYRLKPEKSQQKIVKLESNSSHQKDLSLIRSQIGSENSCTCSQDCMKLQESAIATTNSKQSALSDAVAKVWTRFKGSISDRVTILEQANTALTIGELSDELRQQATREAHKLAGSLGTFGLAEGSRLAREMESLLQNTPRQDQAPQLSQLVTTLRYELETKKWGEGERGGGRDLKTRRLADSQTGFDLTAPSPSLPVSSSHLLLIVDEDGPLTEALVAEAHRQGLQTQIATNLSKARDVFCQQTKGNDNSFYPDVVLLDLNLNEGERLGENRNKLGNSYQLLAELANQTPPVSVLVFARQGNFSDRVKVARLGGKAFLQKPVLPAQAIEVVLDVLRRSRIAEAKVMVVDDDPQMLTTLRVLLEPWGIKTFTISDPRQFWETLEIVAPDLLVLDIEMPYLTGIELCLTVRNDPCWSGLPVMFLTVHTDAEAVHKVFAAGADDYVSKPVVGPELVNRIVNRLERSQLLRSRAETDALTGVANRRRSTQDLSQFLHLADRHSQPLCFALLDLDRFKQVNDEYGHASGDGVLRRLGEILLRTFHAQDVVARWGGEEFVVGMYGMTKGDAIERLGDVLANWRAQEFADSQGRKFRVTFSAGIAEYPSDGIDLQTLYRAADGALYQAKAAGRDRVVAVNAQTKTQNPEVFKITQNPEVFN
ncbi:MAG TPA: response regulator [Kamptonema sp.]|nr:response regulator [Kamptonema sp.]